MTQASKTKKIEVLKYNVNWPTQFQKEANKIKSGRWVLTECCYISLFLSTLFLYEAFAK